MGHGRVRTRDPLDRMAPRIWVLSLRRRLGNRDRRTSTKGGPLRMPGVSSISFGGRDQRSIRFRKAMRPASSGIVRRAAADDAIRVDQVLAMATGLKIAIVGGGLAGLAAAMKIAEAGYDVDIISVVPVKRSHSVCAQGGINGAVNTKGEGDSPAKHLDDTVYGGDFLANPPPVKRMCDMAPQIIYLFDRMGVPFSRTKEGLMDFRRFGGTLHNRTAFSGASTGQQLLYALDEQVRKWETVGKVTKYEGWEM